MASRSMEQIGMRKFIISLGMLFGFAFTLWLCAFTNSLQPSAAIEKRS